MKKAIILHGLNGYAGENWFPWLKNELEKEGWHVWVPDLPSADKPSSKRWTSYVLRQVPFAIDNDTVIIAHSAGCVAALALLQQLPEQVHIAKCILVAALKNDLSYAPLCQLFDIPLDFERIKKHTTHTIVIQSDNDPYMSVDHGRYISERVGGDLIIRHGEKHFSTSTGGIAYTRLPFLRELLIK